MVSDIPAVRLERLRTMVSDKGALSVRAAMTALDVSEMTVRRDFAALAAMGAARRTRGGIVAADRVVADLPYTEREGRQTAAKREIGALAVQLVEDNDVMFISGATTCLAFAQALRGQRNVTVITNSVNVLTTLMPDPRVSVIASGGSVSAQDHDMTGPVTVEALKRFRVNKAFIGASGVSADGVFNSNLARAETDEIMVHSALHAYVLADGTKLDTVALRLVAPIESISGLVTDTRPTAATMQWLDEAGIDTITTGATPVSLSERTTNHHE